MIPRATYRVQFHAGFGFADAEACADYWADLGVSHIYASPIATARAGSMHGYDVVDPTTINPELGGEAGFRSLCAALRSRGMGVVLDIVPNHMAVGGADNPWWLDVLESGAASPYARYFDIDWTSGDPDLEGRLLAPFLGASYAEALAAGDLKLEFDPETHCLFATAYGVHRFPIRAADYRDVLEAVEARDLWELKPRLLQGRYDARTETGRRRLHDLLDKQAYRLADWRTARDRINWRRFFDITELAGLRIEDPEVFDVVHALTLRLYREGLIDGLRVDHVDGLADPAAYGRRLRAALDAETASRPAQAAPGPAYLVVEKILARRERMPTDWGVDGESGYAFMNTVSALLHDPSGAEPLGRLWAEVSGRPSAFAEEETTARAELLRTGFAGQLEAATLALERLARSRIEWRDVTRPALRRVLAALLVVMPQYRFYGLGEAIGEHERAVVRSLRGPAAAGLDPSDHATLDLVLSWITGETRGEAALHRDGLRRLAQLSAPIAAKAVEDTAFYRYGRLLSRNDVGFDPERLGATPAEFHEALSHRVSGSHPLLATATHDHKRGEDVRARLSVLSEIPAAWAAAVRPWLARVPEGVEAADAYMLLQTLVGAWPLDLEPSDAAGVEAFAARVEAWQVKALREAKLRSSWMTPDEAYEGRCRDWLHRFLDDDEARTSVSAFVDRIAPAGVARSLVQTLLRFTAPGVPDTYQGGEFWDFSLVDPDNRRPVRFSAPKASEDWRSPWGKYALSKRLLQLRADRTELFAEGDYRPLVLAGRRADEAIGFLRSDGQESLVVVAAVRGAEACMDAGRPEPGAAWWDDTVIVHADGTREPVADRLGGQAHGWWLIG